jgi:transposase
MSVEPSTLDLLSEKVHHMSDTLTMNQKERNYAHILRLLLKGDLTITEASVQLGISERHCYRLKAEFLQRGDAALVHRLRGRPSNNRYSKENRDFVLDVFRRVYTGFGPTLLSETLAEEYDLVIDSETIRRWLLAAGLWMRARKGRRHRKKRPRRDAVGELVQCDGSHHDWFEGRGPKCCLFVFIDDASSRTVLRFAPLENEEGALDVLRRYIDLYGIPEALYIDRHSVYWSETTRTQFARAVEALGCRLIYARSPQAKGRVERANRTHQDRLVKMLRLANISTIEAANDFLENGYLDTHNTRFANTDGLTDVHRDATHLDLDNIICHQEERVVNHDMTIRVKSTFYQLLATNKLLPVPRQRVIIRHWLDGSMHVFWRERELSVSACVIRPSSTRVVHPPEDHPWRHSKPIGKAKHMTISQLCQEKS